MAPGDGVCVLSCCCSFCTCGAQGWSGGRLGTVVQDGGRRSAQKEAGKRLRQAG